MNIVKQTPITKPDINVRSKKDKLNVLIMAERLLSKEHSLS